MSVKDEKQIEKSLKKKLFNMFQPKKNTAIVKINAKSLITGISLINIDENLIAIKIIDELKNIIMIRQKYPN